jgi:Zn finger protein HypA/HybF involved in hydrogenase expression
MPSLESIEEAMESNQGWCTTCQEWTNDCVEPDARKYKCEVCGERTVFGAEECVIMGLAT